MNIEFKEKNAQEKIAILKEKIKNSKYLKERGTQKKWRKTLSKIEEVLKNKKANQKQHDWFNRLNENIENAKMAS